MTARRSGVDPRVAADALGLHYLSDMDARFTELRRLAERAVAQVDDAEFFAAPDLETNSIAVLMKHIAGNLRSRFTDLLTTDGEKSWRDRDAEFVVRPAETRDAIMTRWAESWNILLDTLDTLTPADLTRVVTIRREPHTVMQALSRQLAHHAQHVGQIVLLAKHASGSRWRTLSVPRGESERYTRAIEARIGPPRD